MKLIITGPGELIRRTKPIEHTVTTQRELAYLNAGRPVLVAGVMGGMLAYRLGREGEITYLVKLSEWDDGGWDYCPDSQEGDERRSY
jgi:hypothetical protein